MNITIKIFSLVLLVCLLYSCDWITGKSRHPKSIVFCDFTSSIDSEASITKIKFEALQILRTQAKERSLEFYSITKDNNSNCLFASNPVSSGAKPSELAEFDSAGPSREKKLLTALDSASSKAALINRREPSSCIMDAVERAIGYFRNEKNYTSESLRLYILSDMQECCRLNGNYKMCIEDETPLVTDSTLMKIKEVANLSQSFKDMKNLEVYIIVATSYKKEGSASRMKDFWEAVFRIYGYDKPIYYAVSLPRN